MDTVTFFEHKPKLKKLILDKTGIDIDKTGFKKHFFSKEFARVFEQNEPQQYKDRLLYFHYFLNQLEKIKGYSKKDFNDYLSKLATDGTNLVGEKFEILTYARLIDKSISFLKPENNPDFEFKFPNGSIFIECGTRQTDKKGYFVESVQQAITNKQAKGLEQNYANNNTALHIEISKTVYNSHGGEDFLETKTLEDILEKSIKTVDYGALVLIYTFYAQEDGIVYGNPIIMYNDNCNNDLKELHKKMFDLQKLRVTPILKRHL